MAGIPTELQHGFWLGLGLALAFLVWGMIQLLIHRAEGSR
jgi:tetrahydromethanopterin S-methyltransferase subunit B